MARRKNAPDLVKLKCGVAERLRDLRSELYGERGGPELARDLGLPVRTWYNYEAGVTVPAEVILRLIEITRVEATWLLHGLGSKFREAPAPEDSSVESLLRIALERLERGTTPLARRPTADSSCEPLDLDDHPVLDFVRVDGSGPGPVTMASGPGYLSARGEWQAACREYRCMRVTDDSMSPLIAPGAYVAYAGADASPADIDTRLVVAWVDGTAPVVRWLHTSGRFALLRSETGQSTTTVDLESQTTPPRFRTVSWISTPR